MESGIITTPYDFAQVYIDSVNMGIYAVEEHFTLKMLKLNKRKAGPILRFNEDIHWEEELQLNDLIIKDSCLGYNGTGNFKSTKISLYDSYDYINKDSIVMKAIDKLNNFRNNEIVISEHFDLNLWAKYFAICEVFGANHGTRWHNVRFYYNPETELIEPIGYDCGYVSGKPILHEVFDDNEKEFSNERYLRMFFSDTVFMKRYITELRKINNIDYIEKSYNINPKERNKISKELNYEFDVFYNKTKLIERQGYIEEVYNPIKPLYSYFKNDTLIFSNSYKLPINVTKLKSANDSILFNDLYLPPKSKKENLFYTKKINPFNKKDKIIVFYEIIGERKIRTLMIDNYYNN